MSDAEPTAKKQRINRACVPCRKRKTRCDGEQPECSTCDFYNRICQYPDEPRRRGLQSGYVRSLETTLGLFLKHIPKCEYQIRTFIRDQNANLVDLDVWRNSGLAKDIEQLLDNTEDTSNHGFELEYVRILSELDPPADDGISLADQPDTSSEVEATQRVDNRQEYPPPTFRSLETNILEQPLPDNIMVLIEHYFLYTQSWIPLLERHDILRSIYTESLTTASDNRDRGFRVAIWALVAFTMTQKGNVSQSANKITPKQIEIMVSNALERDMNDFSIGHVQAALIVILLRIGKEQLNAAWIMIAQVSRMLQVHNRSLLGEMRYQYCMRCCYVLDVFVSSLLNIKPYSPLWEYIEAVIPTEDTIEEWEPWKGLSQVTDEQYVPVVQQPLRSSSTFRLLSELMYMLAGFSMSQPNIESARIFVTKVNTWKARLPLHRALHPTQGSDPAILTLHLMWYFVLCTVLEKEPALMTEHNDALREIVSSFSKKLTCCVQITGPSGLSPILQGITLRVKSFLSIALEHSTLSSARQAKDLLSGTLTIIAKQWCTRNYGERGTGIEDSLLNPHDQNIATIRSKNDAPEVSIDVPGDEPGVLGPSQTYLGADQTADVNDYDKLFDELVSSVPPRR